MPMRSAFSILALVLCAICIFASGCGKERLSPAERKIVAQAELFLRSHHLKVEDFDPPRVCYNTNTHAWGVKYWPKSRIIEGDAFVTIDEKTGKIGCLYGLDSETFMQPRPVQWHQDNRSVWG